MIRLSLLMFVLSLNLRLRPRPRLLECVLVIFLYGVLIHIIVITLLLLLRTPHSIVAHLQVAVGGVLRVDRRLAPGELASVVSPHVLADPRPDQ
jgi:hypothetical protein